MNVNSDRTPCVEVGEADFESVVLHSKQPVLVVFWAPWSHPCQILDTALNEVATACTGKVKVVKINADDNPDLSLMCEIQSIPTLLFFVNGSLRAKVVGTVSTQAILSKWQSVFRDSDATAPAPTQKGK